MSDCQECGSARVVSINGKCQDLFSAELETESGETARHEGYVPSDLGIGDGDYIEMEFCLECGKIQGDFPLSTTELEESIEEESEEEDEDPFGDPNDDGDDD